MVIIWGTTHAGKVDEVPGLFHVVTQFGHLYYIPLIPTGSYIVLEKNSDGGFRGVSIPISFKSWLVAWMRAGAILGLVVAGILLLVAMLEAGKNPGNVMAWITPVLLAAIATTVLVLSYKLKFIRQASYERAVHLARHVGLTDMGMLMIEVAYGRMTAAQADAELAKVDQQVYETQLTDQGNSAV
jgi:hypothetical protein